MATVKFLFCFVAFAISLANAEEDGRIVHGMLISIRQAPYVLQVRYDGFTFCGASLIAPKFAITAAHCVIDKPVDEFDIVSGATTIAEEGVQRKVARHLIHPDYTDATKYSDIAMLELDATILNTPTLELCKQQLNEGDLLDIYGWGRQSFDSELSQNLRTVTVPVRSQETCRNEYTSYVKHNMFCASGLKEIGACSGDSGGPAVYKGQLCGILAFVYECGKIGHTDAYTDVYAVRPFIEKFMNGN